ncbi:MAG: hypothetical protein M1831_003456 [Alyxoria varia]|nr:MAG: hypothetical protein M1831_003456 [Alyxoria varia]
MVTFSSIKNAAILSLPLVSAVLAGSSHSEFHKRQAGSIAVTGAGSGVEPRLELRTLAADKDAWNVFLLAMQRLMKRDHRQDDSWFAIAGIHGMPFEEWDGAKPVAGSGGKPPKVGYSIHSSPLFPAWHRPYIALIEQMLLEEVQNVVNSFSGSKRQRYADASKTMRFPYWDWALPPAGESVLPDVLATSEVTVDTESGERTIPNPLYQYSPFDPVGGGSFGQGSIWDEWENTYRYPAGQNNPTTSDNSQAAAKLDADLTSNRQSVYNVLSTCKDYGAVAADGVEDSNVACHNSLEGVHNGIHTAIGGGGHMAYNNYAAFDPIFHLHHCNVDRIFAIWQKLNPTSWIGESSIGEYGSFALKAKTRVNGDTPLSPFSSNTNGQFWTVNGVRDHESSFHYTYPELMDGQPPIQQLVNDMYGSDKVPKKSPLNPLGGPSSAAGSSPTASAKGSEASGAESSRTTNAPEGGASDAAAAASSKAAALSIRLGRSFTLDIPLPGINVPVPTPGAGSGSGSDAIPTPGSGSARGSSGNASQPTPGDLGSLLTPTGKKFDYKANIVSEKHGLDSSYSIYVFLDFGKVKGLANNSVGIGNKFSPNDNPVPFSSPKGASPNKDAGPDSKNSKEWIKLPSYVGSKGIFANAPNVASDHSKGHTGSMSSNLVAGSVPLTAALVGRVALGDLPDMQEHNVLPYLTKHLSWRVAKANGDHVENAKVPGLTVSAAHSKVIPAASGKSMPHYGSYHVTNSVTHGKAGGLQRGMEPDWWNMCGME